MTQQFSQMNVSQGQQPPPPAKAPVLNQLYPTDLSNQPFNVAELDYPPPPAILPPNVSISSQLGFIALTCPLDKCDSLAVRKLPSQIRPIYS
jgi:hypothetical protein